MSRKLAWRWKSLGLASVIKDKAKPKPLTYPERLGAIEKARKVHQRMGWSAARVARWEWIEVERLRRDFPKMLPCL